MLYKVQPDKTQITFWGRFFPSSSAVRYIEPVRTPAIPATRPSDPRDRTSCSRPMPAGPIRPDRYT